MHCTDVVGGDVGEFVFELAQRHVRVGPPIHGP
jgi:hypothetical protein